MGKYTFKQTKPNIVVKILLILIRFLILIFFSPQFDTACNFSLTPLEVQATTYSAFPSMQYHTDNILPMAISGEKRCD